MVGLWTITELLLMKQATKSRFLETLHFILIFWIMRPEKLQMRTELV